MQEKPKARGRPAVSDERRRNKNFTFRGTVQLHEKLRVAALRANRSVSDEINNRLEESFDDDLDPDKVFASRAMFGLMKLVATAMQISGHAVAGFKTDIQSPEFWYRDPYAFAQAVFAAHTIFERLHPKGDRGAPRHKDLALANHLKNIGGAYAEAMISEMILEGAMADVTTATRGARLRRDLDSSMTEILDQQAGGKNEA